MDANRKPLAIGIGVVGLLALVLAFWFTRGGENNANAPEGTYWICSNPQCKNEFNLSIADVSDHHRKHYGEPITCPKCGQRAIPADKCPHCKQLFPAGRGLAKCPKCGKDLTAPPPASSRGSSGDQRDAAVRLDDQRRRSGDVELLHAEPHGPPRIHDVNRHPADG
jgi:hypothetical protein